MGRIRTASLTVAAVALTPLAVVVPVAVSPAQAAPTELLFSEYIEGTSNNKALEVYNGTGAAIDLTANAYNVQMFFNGSAAAGLTINLTGAVADGDVFVLAQASANAAILAQADQTNGAGWFNGDDAVVLRKGTTVIDVIGQVGFDPGTEWGTGLTSTMDNTLRRKAAVEQGDALGTDAFDPSLEWDGFATDTFDRLGSRGDPAPIVTATNPANAANGVPRNTDITVTFSEPVNVAGAWFTISCATSGAHTAVASGGPTSFTLNPDVDFAAAEVCTVTVLAAGVADQDGEDPPDAMAADTVFNFTTTDALACGDPATLIHDIQGGGTASPLVGAPGVGRSIEGVVVGDYQGPGQFSGYYVQEEDADVDADPATSEGIFVFNTSFPVAAGDVVRVRGNVVEFTSGTTTLTELTSVTSVLVCAAGGSVTPTTVQLPVPSVGDWERYEGMRISLPQQLAVTETFTLGRFGEVGLSLGSRLLNPTSVAAPGAPALAVQDLNDRSRILLDDANNQQNIDPTLYPAGGLTASNTLRSGDTVTGLSGVLDQRFSLYRIQPVGPVPFTAANLRPAAPADVGGGVKVASMNVLNYFNGPNFPTSRGASTPQELVRQRDKIVSAIVAIDADILGLNEIENDAGPSSALAELTNELNAVAGAGTYAFIDTGVVGGDEIRVALVYKPATVTPEGDFAVLTSAVDPLFIDTLNRPALAQTFSENANGQEFTVVVNHLKSKGSTCDHVGDPDTGDGQGNCNVTRTNAATALANWLATDPTGSGDDDVLIIGDLNSYAQEDPITALKDGGYTNLVEKFLGPGAYSFVFQGQSGYLDHALANPTFEPQVTGVTEWHINADEPIALDYNVEFKSANHVTTLYAPTPFRSADHDPVIVGVCQAPTLHMTVSPNVLRPPNHAYRTVTATPDASSDVTPADIELLSVTSNEPDDGEDDGNTVNDIVIVDDLTVQLRAERSGTGNGRIYTLTWRATNGCGATTTDTATVTVPRG